MHFVVACIILIAILGIYYYKNKQICEKCNVILVSLDTLSALHLPCYGYERNTAPNLCAYADKNILFANSYSNAPITLDSHFSIFTSLYPSTHKMIDILGDKLNEKYLTLAQLFRLNGYQTIYHGPISDQHMPLDRGIERGFNTIDVDSGANAKDWNWNEAYSKLLKNADKEQSTFLFLHTYTVHFPYLTGHSKKHLFTDIPEYPNIALTQEEFTKFSLEFFSFTADLVITNDYMLKNNEKAMNVTRQIAEKLKNEKDIQKAKEIFNTFSDIVRFISFGRWQTSKINTDDPKQIEYYKALYDEKIFNLDRKLGELFKLMEDPRLSKNTILIITADHGEEFMEHGNLYHGQNLYRTQTQVPLIIHIPGVKPKKIHEMVQGIDIYPTALSLTGLSPKSPIEGIDLSGLVLGKKNAKKNRYLRSEFQGGIITAIQDTNWRFYYQGKNKTPKELYNLADDPGEKKNVISSNPKKVDEILRLIR